MPKRNLRIVKRFPAPLIGVSEACNQQFKSDEAQLDRAEWAVSNEFAFHKCPPMDLSQNALRIVTEATKDA